MESGTTNLSSMWCSIKDLHPTKMRLNAAIKLRVVRIYEVPSPKNKKEIVSIEAIAHDSKCERISMTIPLMFVKKWQSTMKEGLLYGIKNFMVVHNEGRYKINTHEYKIKFNFQTEVKRMIEDDFPKQIYLFKGYDEIQNMEVLKDGELLDIIGILLNKPTAKSITTNMGMKKKLVDLILQDIEGKRITCTLWDNYVDHFMESLEKQGQPSNIIILQLGKPNMYQGKMKMQSAYFVSKVTINADIQEVSDFKQRVVIATDFSTTIIGSASEKSISCLTKDEGDAFGNLKTIDELSFANENEIFWILGTIVNIDLEKGWYYISCKVCNKKLMKQEHCFYCSKCNKTDKCGNMRYKMIVDVMDERSCVNLLLWERECVQMIGKNVADLIQNEESIHDLPDSIYNALMGRKFMFKIPVKAKGDRSYSVIQVNCDLTLINSYNHSNNLAEESYSNSKVDEGKMGESQIEEFIPIETPISKIDLSAEESYSNTNVDKGKMDETNEMIEIDTPISKIDSKIDPEDDDHLLCQERNQKYL